MRQFLLGKNVAYTSAATLTEVADGAIGFFYNKAGVPTVTKTGTEITKEAMLVLGRPVGKGGPVVLPIHKNKFSFVKGEYQQAKAFAANTEIPSPKKIGTYSIIIVLKGKKFNERNKYTADVYVNKTTMTNVELAAALAKKINMFAPQTGLKATPSSQTINFAAENKGVDYNIVCADELIGNKVNITQVGEPAYGDAAYITDLANKAAADAGIEYTYQDVVTELYPNYPLNPLKANDASDVGFTIFTLKFAEPREVKTRDEVVNQIVQVAFPTGAAPIATFETVCKALAGEAALSPAKV